MYSQPIVRLSNANRMPRSQTRGVAFLAVFDITLFIHDVERQAVCQLGRLQHARDAIDGRKRWNLVHRVRSLQFLELARLDEDVALERPDGAVVRLEAALQLRAEI